MRSSHFMANRRVRKVEGVTDFIFLGSKVSADSDCSHEIKRYLLLGGKIITNLNSVLKNKHITLLRTVFIVKAMVSPVVMYGCQSWIIKKTGHWRTDAFKVWWGRLLRVPWTARRSNQFWKKSTLNIHWKDWSWNWSSNILATWCEEPTYWERSWC